MLSISERKRGKRQSLWRATLTNDANERFYPTYVLIVMSLVTILNYYDRYVITILLQPIKLDLGISDSELGILTGLTFSVAYSVALLPIARFADRERHVKTLGIGLAAWSIMTAACGMSANFITLLLARTGVGVAEASGAPTTHAIVAKYFGQRHRATALSVIAAAGGVGLAAGTIGGGAIASAFGWRYAFLIGGAAGVFCSLLVLLTVRQPAAVDKGRQESRNFLSATRTLFSRRSFVWLIIGTGLGAVNGYAILVWTPTLLMRKFSLSSHEVGVKFGLAMTVPSLFALLVGGFVVDRLIKRDIRWFLWVPSLMLLLNVPFTVTMFSSQNLNLTLSLVVLVVSFNNFYAGSVYSLVQSLSGTQHRSTGAAFYMFVNNTLGLTIGASIPGILSDSLAPTYGVRSLEIALCITASIAALGGGALLIGTRSLRRDLEDADGSDDAA